MYIQQEICEDIIIEMTVCMKCKLNTCTIIVQFDYI